MVSKIIKKCKECGETISGDTGEELRMKQKKHKLSCHQGFEVVKNGYTNP